MGEGGCIKPISEGNLISHRSNCLRFSIFQHRKIKHSFLPLSFLYLNIEEQEDGGGESKARVTRGQTSIFSEAATVKRGHWHSATPDGKAQSISLGFIFSICNGSYEIFHK